MSNEKELEKKAILERFSKFMEPIKGGWTYDDVIFRFLDNLHSEDKQPKFHGDNEIRTMCVEWLCERSAAWFLGIERDHYYTGV